MSASVISMHIFPGHSNALGYDRLKGLSGVKCSEVSVQQIKNDILTCYPDLFCNFLLYTTLSMFISFSTIIWVFNVADHLANFKSQNYTTDF